MSTVTVSITQHVQIARTAPGTDPATVGSVVGQIVQNDLVPATGLDWTTLAVSVTDDPA